MEACPSEMQKGVNPFKKYGYCRKKREHNFSHIKICFVYCGHLRTVKSSWFHAKIMGRVQGGKKK